MLDFEEREKTWRCVDTRRRIPYEATKSLQYCERSWLSPKDLKRQKPERSDQVNKLPPSADHILERRDPGA